MCTECCFTNDSFGISIMRRLPSFCSEYAPNAFTKSGKRKISTVAKPLAFVALYLPTVSSSAWYAANTGPSGPRYVTMCSFGTTTGSVSSFHPGASSWRGRNCRLGDSNAV